MLSSIISASLHMPLPNSSSNCAVLKGGACLFFTTLTRTWLPTVCREKNHYLDLNAFIAILRSTDTEFCTGRYITNKRSSKCEKRHVQDIWLGKMTSLMVSIISICIQWTNKGEPSAQSSRIRRVREGVPPFGVLYTALPCFYTRGCFQDLNQWPFSHMTTTSPLRQGFPLKRSINQNAGTT